MNIAIVGATGNVGRKLLEVIEKLNFKFSELYLIASDKSIGKKIIFKGNKFFIARSGWSKQGGYEIYVENREAGLNLYDELFSAGKEFNVKPGCPNLIERIESGLLSCGNDFDNGDNPYECGFDKYIDIQSDINYLGKKALVKISKEGIKRKLMGVKIDLDKIEMMEERLLQN